MAYVARYANQPRSEIRAMPVDTFAAWLAAIGSIVVREHTPEQ